ncbi:uncharacterized protein LOC142242966 [Haematobia irritans]|uniref:uncharacterized protein LOC142242966 n=1 Tax=Haematobia irritans TaxID=7368 RepID=UPI003F4FBABE
MRAFIVLCLLAVACADHSGYNYQPVGQSGSGLSFAPGAAGFGSTGGGYVSTGGNGFGSTAPGFSGGNTGALYSAPAEYQKEFYSFSAPEDDFDDVNAIQRAVGSLKQGLRVVFIKGPENNGLENAALALAKQAAQQQTAIYVLNKQTDLGEFANKLNAVHSGNNFRPEVHFVKYRTPEDAANAQRAIQGQYDSLGGSSHNFNGGVAPVINFASQAPIHTPAPQTPQNAYLPSSVFRYRL